MYSLHEEFDTRNVHGRLQLGLYAQLAQFERNLMKERTMAGLAAAKASGKRVRRPPPKITVDRMLANEMFTAGPDPRHRAPYCGTVNSRPKWRDDELALLDSWTGTDTELAEQLGRSTTAIRRQRRRRTNPDAAEKDRAYADRYRERRARLAYLRQRINRERYNAEDRVRAAAHRAATTTSGPYQPEEDAILLQLNLSTQEVASRLGRTPLSIRRRRRRLLAQDARPARQPDG